MSETLLCPMGPLGNNISMLVFNVFCTKLKIMICLIFNFTNQKIKLISQSQHLRNALSEFIAVTNKMSGKQS